MQALMRALLILLLALMAPVLAARAEQAGILQNAEITGLGEQGRVMLAFDAAPALGVGDVIELVYRAGLLDMLLGRYRVLAARGTRVELAALSVAAPPSRGMRVGVTVASSQVAIPGAPPPPAAAASSSAAGGDAKVVAVRERAAEIALPAGTRARPGDRYSLAFDAPRVGRVPIQGVWTLVRVDGVRAQLEPEGAGGQPRVGQLALPLAAPDANLASKPATSPATGGLFESIADPAELDFDAFLARQAAQPQAPPYAADDTASGTPTAAGGRGWVGLVLQSLTPELALTAGLAADTRGALVADLTPGGPAQRAGLRPGDVILELDGAALDAHAFSARIRATPPGTLLRLRLARDGARLFLAVRVGTLP